MAPTNPFSFGQFKLYLGRNSYTMAEAEITNYFENLRMDFEGAYYGMYFLEICDYYARENNDEAELLKLLYQSLRALNAEQFSKKLVRYIFELKSIMINGEFPGITWYEAKMCDSTRYMIDYIMRTPVEKLYSFKVNAEVLNEIKDFNKKMCANILDKNFKSLEILENIE